MNRAQRRNLKRVVAKAIKGKPGLAHPVPDSVVLRGGPMDGWIVKPGADALRPDWYMTWPPSVAARNQPGRYELAEGGKRATWAPNTIIVTNADDDEATIRSQWQKVPEREGVTE